MGRKTKIAVTLAAYVAGATILHHIPAVKNWQHTRVNDSQTDTGWWGHPLGYLQESIAHALYWPAHGVQLVAIGTTDTHIAELEARVAGLIPSAGSSTSSSTASSSSSSGIDFQIPDDQYTRSFKFSKDKNPFEIKGLEIRVGYQQRADGELIFFVQDPLNIGIPDGWKTADQYRSLLGVNANAKDLVSKFNEGIETLRKNKQLPSHGRIFQENENPSQLAEVTGYEGDSVLERRFHNFVAFPNLSTITTDPNTMVSFDGLTTAAQKSDSTIRQRVLTQAYGAAQGYQAFIDQYNPSNASSSSSGSSGTSVSSGPVKLFK